MKNLLFRTAALALICLAACNKNNIDDPNDKNGFIDTPGPSPIQSNLVVYSADPYDYSMQVFASDILEYSATDDKYFTNGAVAMDKYASVTRVRNNSTFKIFDFYKTFTALSSAKNYADYKLKIPAYVGVARTNGPALHIDLPGGGKYDADAGVFGFVQYDISFNIFANYYSPSVKDFAISTPHQPFADSKFKRGFLDSYGIYQLEVVLANDLQAMPHYDTSKGRVMLRMPIDPSRMANAPDSLAAFQLDNQAKWEWRGIARKVNGFYEAEIDYNGFWNFAEFKEGVYVTIHLTTANGFSLGNTRYVVKRGNLELSEGRTNAEGYALVFVPTHESLSIDIVNDHFRNWDNFQFTDVSIGSFNAETQTEVVLPARVDISTLQGEVYNCDGSKFADGSVLISQKGAKDQYSVPILDGKFSFAQWKDLSLCETNFSFRNAGGSEVFQVNSLLGSVYDLPHVKNLYEKFYACTTAPQLFTHYKIDTTTYTLDGSLGQGSAKLSANYHPGGRTLMIGDATKGISFEYWMLGPNSGSISGGLPLIINGETCSFTNGTSEITVYRDDNVAGGITEGWFAIDYLDPRGMAHTASGNFRVEIKN